MKLNALCLVKFKFTSFHKFLFSLTIRQDRSRNETMVDTAAAEDGMMAVVEDVANCSTSRAKLLSTYTCDSWSYLLRETRSSIIYLLQMQLCSLST